MGKLEGEGLWLWSLLLVKRMKRDMEQVTDGTFHTYHGTPKKGLKIALRCIKEFQKICYFIVATILPVGQLFYIIF